MAPLYAYYYHCYYYHYYYYYYYYCHYHYHYYYYYYHCYHYDHYYYYFFWFTEALTVGKVSAGAPHSPASLPPMIHLAPSALSLSLVVSLGETLKQKQ